MKERDKVLRERVAENLRFAEKLGQKVGRIRDLFEERLKEHPLNFWSPSFKDFKRQELYGYGMCKLEGEFSVEGAVGQYDLSFTADGTDLPNSRLEIFGTVGGYEAFDYVLPPVASIAIRNREQLEALQAKVGYLEAILKMIGLLSDEENQPD